MNESQHAALSYLRDYLERSPSRLEETQRALRAVEYARFNEHAHVNIAQALNRIMSWERLFAIKSTELLADHGYHTEES